MAVKTSIRLDVRLANEAVKVLGVKSRTEAVRVALKEIVALGRPKAKERARSKS
jgi:Arc/MetJ family transcription regulator